jgi:hypothetical protein
MSKTYKKFVAIVGSKKFFWAIILLFIIESVWFALSARYPMAFDEAYHLTSIQIYSHQFSPFFFKQPPGPLTYGPLVHNTSYLFHYLMSYPFRFIRFFTKDLTTQVIFLRFIDIGLFTWALFLFKKLLLKVKHEPALANITILFFILIPIVPFLAGQINYDDLIIPLTALSLLWTIRFVEQLRTKQQLNLPILIGTLSVVFFASVVSYIFLPILAAVTLYLAYVIVRFTRAHPNQFKNAVRYSWFRIKPIKKVLLFIVLLVGFGLFVESYVVNLVEYHNPIAQCNQVLSVSRCETYSPWARNYHDAQSHGEVNKNPIRYTLSWVDGMYDRMLFTINGPSGPEGYANPSVLPVLSISIAIVLVGGVLLFIRYGRNLLKTTPYLKFLLFVDIIFLVSLWSRNYHDYLQLGQMVAINGRYLLPITIPIIFTLGLCYKKFFNKKQGLTAGAVIIVLLCLLQGGGVISFIHASDANWYWPNNQLVLNINSGAQKVIKPFIIK